MTDYRRLYCMPARAFAEITYLFPHSGPESVDERRARAGKVHVIVSTAIYVLAGYLAFAGAPMVRAVLPLASPGPIETPVAAIPAAIPQGPAAWRAPAADALAQGRGTARATAYLPVKTRRPPVRADRTGADDDTVSEPGGIPSIREMRCRPVSDPVSDGQGADGSRHSISLCD